MNFIDPNCCSPKQYYLDKPVCSKVTLPECGNPGVKSISGGIRSVFFGKTPPFDTCIPWQKVDDCGAPIGKIQYFKNGKWSA